MTINISSALKMNLFMKFSMNAWINEHNMTIVLLELCKVRASQCPNVSKSNVMTIIKTLITHYHKALSTTSKLL